MADMDMSGGDAGAMGGDDGSAQSAGYTVCIQVGADGSMKVGVEPPEDPAEAPEDGSFKPAPSAKDAMMMVMNIIKNNGKMPEGDPDADFNAGFGKKKPGVMVAKQVPDDEGM